MFASESEFSSIVERVLDYRVACVVAVGKSCCQTPLQRVGQVNGSSAQV